MNAQGAISLSVSVIIPTFKRMDLLPRCLEGVETLQPRPIEVVISYRPDDDPDTARWLHDNAKDHSLWRLVSVERAGVVCALNAAIDVARGDILAIFDDDAVPRPDWLEKILGHFRDDDVGAAGGRDIVFDGDGAPVLHPTVTRAGYRDFWGMIRGGHHLVVGPPRAVEVVKGSNWALRRSALGTLRLDERLLGSGAQVANESWLCINLRKAGWRIILDPNAIVDHYPGVKPDYAYGTWSKIKCFHWTANHVATQRAFTDSLTRLRFFLFCVAVGFRHCPGLYFILHSLAKRPKSLPGQLIGGWSGYFAGLRMAREFERAPPGTPSTPPKFRAPARAESPIVSL
ncbi:glycosyltransferase family 2 protein [Methylosinus sp. Ce-a6]|uniref:glycosyltransferase family 2 protein n=1 Tax=Methylosinus sp. Ce-a6 TaxID=2172005 RepID=UPI0021103A4C|nr:glycosyltransferase family 2 protein [Methylosinus sp. Ce-a6]